LAGAYAVAPPKTSARTASRFGVRNELDWHGETAACRNCDSEANECPNCGAVRRGEART
jgi:hypothetical protein